MNRLSQGLVALGFGIAVAGCSTSYALREAAPDLRVAGVRYDTPEEPVKKAPPEPHEDQGIGLEKKVVKDYVQIEEKKIQEMTAQKVTLTFPAKVAVVKIGKVENLFKPSPLDREELTLFTQALNDSRRVSTVETLPSVFLTQETDLIRLRYAAARIGADFLFVYIHDKTTVSNYNSASNANFLILPIAFVKGKTVEVGVGMEGILVHVPTNTVHVVTTAKSKGKKDIHTLASDSDAFEEMGKEHYDLALKDLAAGLAQRLATIQR